MLVYESVQVQSFSLSERASMGKRYDYSVSRNLVDTLRLCIVTVLTTAVQHTISWQTVCNPTCRALGSLETRCKLANYK